MQRKQVGGAVPVGQTLVELDPTSARADKVSLQDARSAAQSEGLRTRLLQYMLSNTE